jgi:hypothetical protein
MSRRRDAYVLGLLALVVWGGLASGWWSSSDRSAQSDPPKTTSTTTPTHPGGLAAFHAEPAETGQPPKLVAALNDPDPRARIRALETWAQHPGEDLNPVTYALIDPDESVRARAQELLEAVLARR